MDAADTWRMLFESWPEAIPRQAAVVTVFNELIPFNGFMVSGGIVLLDREKPDTQGARKVMVAYSAIAAVKFMSVLELSRFQVMGFQAPM